MNISFARSSIILVPEAGIEPARPLFTKAADFKLVVPKETQAFAADFQCKTATLQKLCKFSCWYAKIPIKFHRRFFQ